MELVWDQIGEHRYESGLDRGVLYLPDNSAVVWNGLTSVTEKFDRSTSPLYFDGMKIQDIVALGDFSAKMKAFTYPDQFLELEGVGKFRPGVFLGDQTPKAFSLSYRTKIGDDVSGDAVGYKIHIIYNVTAIPTDRVHATNSDHPSVLEFEWDITAIPEEIVGFRPTAHLIFDTRFIPPLMLEDLEAILYGSVSSDARLLSFPELVTFLRDWFIIRITDNGDGTWTANEDRPGFILMLSDTEFQIFHVDATFLDSVTYEVSSTLEAI